jgi:hypothetical protein
MTQKEIDAEKKLGWYYLSFKEMTPKQLHRYYELSCIDMINSLLAYEYLYTKNAEQILKSEEASYRDYLKSHIDRLGRGRVLELIQEQINDIKGIKKDVYTDSEDVTYNSIDWAR